MEGTTVVLTGGTRGIGAATVRGLVEAGATVVTCSRDAEALAELAADVGEPDRLVTQRADVRDEYDVERFLEVAAREGDGIDAVVANAAVYHGDAGATPIHEESYAAYDDNLRTNARGAFATFRESIPHLGDGGRLVLVSAEAAREPRVGFGSYAVSKAAAEAVARQFAADCPVPVGIVDPGPVSTGLTDGEGTDPDDAAALIRWALSEADPELLDGRVLDRQRMTGDE